MKKVNSVENKSFTNLPKSKVGSTRSCKLPFGSKYDYRQLQINGIVGFDNITKQLIRRSFKNGYEFNILCIGEPSIGKATFMDTLFHTNFETSKNYSDNPNLTSHTFKLEENNVPLKLMIVKYNLHFNQMEGVDYIAKYVDDQLDSYLREELKFKRSLHNYHDTRIHVCLYFISPTIGLRAIDLICLKKLSWKVNIVPMIAKVDALTKTELENFRAGILRDLKNCNIKLYSFPEEDETGKAKKPINVKVPFGVVGSRDLAWVKGKMKRARLYPWGTVEVENEKHSDTSILRELIFRANMEDLKEKTHNFCYETYRTQTLKNGGGIGFYLYKFDDQTDTLEKKFVLRVKEAEKELKEKEKEINDKFKKLDEAHKKEQEDLDEKRDKLETEIDEFYKITEKSENHIYVTPKKFLGKKKKFDCLPFD